MNVPFPPSALPPHRPYHIPRPADEEELHRRGLQFGYDASLILDFEPVYLLYTHHDATDEHIAHNITWVEYFHGCVRNRAIAQLMDEAKSDFLP